MDPHHLNRPLPLLPFYLTQVLGSWISSKATLSQFFSSPSLSEHSSFFNPSFEEFRKKCHEEKIKREDFEDALNEIIQERWKGLSSGMIQYMSHPYQRSSPEASLIWSKGTTEVWDYGEKDSQDPILILIPSLVNRAYILDLSPRLSLVKFLKNSGFRPWLIDWQAPGEEESCFKVIDYIQERLWPILKEAHEKNKGPVSVLGYCMGGVMALGLAKLCQDASWKALKNMVLLGTPWDFHRPLGENTSCLLKENLNFFKKLSVSFLGEDLLKQGNSFWESSLNSLSIPSELIQLYFHQMISPHNNLQKFLMISDWSPESEKMEDFISVEEWIQEGVPLSSLVAWECFYEWAVENKLARHEWIVGSTPFLPQEMTLPTLCVVADQDRIVPPSSTESLVEELPFVEKKSLKTGHVGMIISKKAPQDLWIPMTQWISQFD